MSGELPVVIIGAGPVGLAAAAQLVIRGEQPLVLEAGAAVGASVRRWGHVRLFSPWRYTTDAAAVRLLEGAGWQHPDAESYPTGAELVAEYLEPLAALPQLRPHIRLNVQVQAVAREHTDKMKTPGRERAPFVVHALADGRPTRFRARAIIDASGTYTSPNPLGADGLPAQGERELADRLHYGIPDVLGRDRQRYAGKRVLVVGTGHSAFNALLELATLTEQTLATQVHWAMRRTSDGTLYGGGTDDALPERGQLGQRLHRLVEAGAVHIHRGIRIDALRRTETGIICETARHELPEVDEIIVTTGFRPDLSLLSELRLALDPITESPVALAPLIDPNVHSCGTVPPHGVAELTHPEPDVYVVGMKSYGRAPTFLLLTGYEQVRSVVCALTGDMAGAHAVTLVLPETGVCSGGGAGGCCEPELAAPASRSGIFLSLG